MNTNNLINLQYQTDILSMIKNNCKHFYMYFWNKHTHTHTSYPVLTIIPAKILHLSHTNLTLLLSCFYILTNPFSPSPLPSPTPPAISPNPFHPLFLSCFSSRTSDIPSISYPKVYGCSSTRHHPSPRLNEANWQEEWVSNIFV